MRRESEFKETLTNEQLLKRFKNQFELVRYAIQLAENTVRSGREPDVYTDSQNVAFQILAEIAANKETFTELPKVQEATPMPKSHEKARFSEPSWNDEVKALKEEKREKRSKSKAAR